MLEEIIVTATKKAEGESVQEVPIAVSAFGEEQLDELKIVSLTDLAASVPNAELATAGSVKGAANFSFRGLGLANSIPSVDPTVGVFAYGV